MKASLELREGVRLSFFFFSFSSASLELSEESRGRPLEDPREVPVEFDAGEFVLDLQEFEKVTADGGVLKKAYVKGENEEAHAQDKYTVWLKYVVRSVEGEILDVSQNDSWKNKEHQFVVGSKEVIQGLDEIAKNLARKEKARFWVRNDYAFGAGGSWPKIGANSDLIIDCEMMGFRRPHKDKLFLRNNEVLPYVLKRKEKGNSWYKNQDFKRAIHEYKSCVKCISFVDDERYKPDLAPVAVQLLGNLCAAHLAVKNYRRVIKYASEVLKLDPTNEKALFRRYKALRSFPDRVEESRKDLLSAIRISPKNREFRKEYDSLLAEIKAHRERDRAAYGSIFENKGQEIYTEKQTVKVFFEIARKRKILGRVEMQLFSHLVPKTCENFRQLCLGHAESGLTYRKTIFHRVIPDYLIQGGDVTMQRGQSGKSIYGDVFDDENFEKSPNRSGLLLMANSGKNTNQSQFFITLSADNEAFEGQYVVFGKVTSGMNVLRQMASCEVDEEDMPVEDIFVFKSGQVKETRDRMVDDSDSE